MFRWNFMRFRNLLLPKKRRESSLLMPKGGMRIWCMILVSRTSIMLPLPCNMILPTSTGIISVRCRIWRSRLNRCVWRVCFCEHKIISFWVFAVVLMLVSMYFDCVLVYWLCDCYIGSYTFYISTAIPNYSCDFCPDTSSDEGLYGLDGW